jgi:uncharacterized membrane protein
MHALHAPTAGMATRQTRSMAARAGLGHGRAHSAPRAAVATVAAAAASAPASGSLPRLATPGLGPARRGLRHAARRAPSVVVAASGNNDGPGVLDRAAAAAPYLIPLVDSLGRGRFLFASYPAVFSVLLGPLRPLASLYYSVPFASLVVFFAVYLGIVQNANASRFARFNAMQAILLDILLVIPSILERVLGGAPRGGVGLSLYMSASSTIFLFVLACFVVAAGSALAGTTTRLPLVADAADSSANRF